MSEVSIRDGFHGNGRTQTVFTERIDEAFHDRTDAVGAAADSSAQLPNKTNKNKFTKKETFRKLLTQNVPT